MSISDAVRRAYGQKFEIDRNPLKPLLDALASDLSYLRMDLIQAQADIRKLQRQITEGGEA